MRPDERDPIFTEDAIDVLMALVGRMAYERMDPMDPRNEPFLNWLAREARLRLTAAERREMDRLAPLFAERVLRRVAAERAAERHRVRCVNEAPLSYPLDEAGESGHADGDDTCAPGARTTRQWDLAVAAGIGRELWDEAPSAVIELPEEVEDGRYVALTVAGDSMAPLLHTGDTMLVKLGPELATDQVVVARHPEHGYVVKRVGRITSMRVELTSLNAAYSPLEIPHDASLILGTVVLRWCPHDRGPLRP